LGTLLGHGFLNLATDQQVTSFIPAPKVSDPVVRSFMTCLSVTIGVGRKGSRKIRGPFVD